MIRVSPVALVLLTAAGLFLVALAAARHVRVRLGGDKDILPGTELPGMGLAEEPEPDDGPVLIQIEYRIAPENRDAFLPLTCRRFMCSSCRT